ncbi:MAG: hypothetical protein EOM66_01780 [Clostridia bacterium]|nr:hypothetical protein [Candidatus Pelethousia sp.]NCB30122.1 hypothetical protein [Clostridia bacterium]
MDSRKDVPTLDIAFMLYAGAIPIVPLIGAEIYKRREDSLRRNLCYGIFALQLLVSFASIILYLRA